MPLSGTFRLLDHPDPACQPISSGDFIRNSRRSRHLPAVTRRRSSSKEFNTKVSGTGSAAPLQGAGNSARTLRIYAALGSARTLAGVNLIVTETCAEIYRTVNDQSQICDLWMLALTVAARF